IIMRKSGRPDLRKGAVGVGVQIDETGQREPDGFNRLLGRPDRRNTPIPQGHAEHSAAARQGAGADGDFVGHATRLDYATLLAQYACGPNTSMPKRRSSARPKRYFISGPS